MPAEDVIRDRISRAVVKIDPDIPSALELVSHRGIQRRRIAIGVKVMCALGILILAAVVGPKIIDFAGEPHAPAQSPTVGPSAIEGTYELRLPNAQHGIVESESMAGSWRIKLGPGGQVDLTPPRGFQGVTSHLTFQVVDGEFRTTAFADLCSMPQPGIYRWSKADGVLRFTIVDDPCIVRQALFTTRPWTER